MVPAARPRPRNPAWPITSQPPRYSPSSRGISHWHTEALAAESSATAVASGPTPRYTLAARVIPAHLFQAADDLPTGPHGCRHPAARARHGRGAGRRRVSLRPQRQDLGACQSPLRPPQRGLQLGMLCRVIARRRCVWVEEGLLAETRLCGRRRREEYCAVSICYGSI
jgi:hypothetical protein